MVHQVRWTKSSEKNQEVYGAFADQCSGNLDVTPRKGARWAGSSLTPVESFGTESPRVMVRSLAFVFFIFMNGVKKNNSFCNVLGLC